MSASPPSRPVVAIDGPAGAGKSTAARTLARRLGYTYIDTGAMYRAVALAALRSGVAWDDAPALERLAEGLRFQFAPGTAAPRLLVNDEDVSEAIRTPEVSRGASVVSQWPGVRQVLVREQRRLGEGGGVVMDGRDVGTVVFPEAEVKVFLTASPGERASRRARELQARGEDAVLPEVLAEVCERDRRDAEREHSPMRRAADAVELPTDNLSLDEVVARIEGLVRERTAR